MPGLLFAQRHSAGPSIRSEAVSGLLFTQRLGDRPSIRSEAQCRAFYSLRCSVQGLLFTYRGQCRAYGSLEGSSDGIPCTQALRVQRLPFTLHCRPGVAYHSLRGSVEGILFTHCLAQGLLQYFLKVYFRLISLKKSNKGQHTGAQTRNGRCYIHQILCRTWTANCRSC